MSEYLHTFLLNEVRLQSHTELERWQEQLTRLFNFVLRHGMPMEQLQIATFREAMFQSRNAEEALLVALNVCAQTTSRRSVIQQPDPTAFGTWLMRIEGQRHVRAGLALRSLSFLALPHAHLFSTNLVGASLESSDLEATQANFLCVLFGNLSNTNFKNAFLLEARFSSSDLSNANFERAILRNADMHWANLTGANLTAADLAGVNLTGANLMGANLAGANLTRANLTRANLTRANLTAADLTKAYVAGANLTGANLTGANLEETILKDLKVDERVSAQIRDFSTSKTRS